MSAIADPKDKSEPIKVLFVLHDDFDTLDFTGPLEIFSHARHNIKDSGMPTAFAIPLSPEA
jgi:hypothetical protein